MEEGFWDQDWVAAAITFGIALAFAFVVDRFVIGRATRMAARLGDRRAVSVSRAVQTRLRLIRRLVFVIIILIGIFLALGEFTKLNRLATGLLASSAVIGIVLGLAARQILANPLAGILLSVSQPIRLGDLVTVADETGRVDDLTLSHTFIDTGDGRLVIVPNETVVTGVVINRSTGDLTAPAMASVWVPPNADLERAREALAGLEPSQVEVAEMTPEGIRIEVRGPRRPGGTRAGGEEAALRERAQRALRQAGVLETAER
ncbi:MAG: MscS Mechanosensitive ion channel [Solirubrobacterales bacterium]|jgi:small-conductance mechanosensitive channel|nr:MscS Mechanosensitive ion channel [Solirubrobacterales bacterium]